MEHRYAALHKTSGGGRGLRSPASAARGMAWATTLAASGEQGSGGLHQEGVNCVDLTGDDTCQGAESGGLHQEGVNCVDLTGDDTCQRAESGGLHQGVRTAWAARATSESRVARRSFHTR